MSENSNPDQLRLIEASFVVMDFETVTPPRRPAEPIELAAMKIAPGLRVDEQFRASWLIKPPDDAPLTPFDTRQTGIRWEDLRDQPPAVTILKEFEGLVCGGQCPAPTILVAHNASYEANIVKRFAENCPLLVGLPFVDTMALAKKTIPNLHSYRLDALAQHFSLPLPPDRHRALPDVQLTVQVFFKLVSLYREKEPEATMADLKRLAGLARSERPAMQMSLFEDVEKE